MSALLSLTEEHQMISGLLGALQTHATRLRSGASVDSEDLGRFSEVLRELVDYRHHEKEEGIVMPLLARNGFDWSTGLLAELRQEHGHLRHLIDILSQAAARDAAARDGGGSPEQRRQVVDVALAFVDYKRMHMQKEMDVLMPAITARLSVRACEQLAADLARFDRGTASEPIEQLASELIQRYSEVSGTIDVTGLRWTEAGRAALENRATPETKAADAGGRGRGLTSFGRSR
jgi:hemerythrin-like domain-containing protein